jgi:hypothetical protein
MATKITNVVGSARTLKAAALAVGVMAGMVGGVGAANAAITGVFGAATLLGTPPLSALPGALVGPPAYCWNEQTSRNFSALNVNLTVNPGFYTGPGANFGVVTGLYDSHMIHFDASSGVANVSGTVTFSNNIAAVIYDNILLDATDLSLGSPGTVYDTGNPFRSYSGGVLNQSIVQLVGNTLHFDLWALAPTNFMSELRVLTYAVPTPGSLALLGLGGLMCARRRRGVA